MKHIPDWAPGANFKQSAAQLRRTLDDVADMPMAMVKKEMAAGEAKPSFLSEQLTRAGDRLSDKDEYEAKWIAASLYLAGADTVRDSPALVVGVVLMVS